jgi:hypothetical protein
MAAGPVQVEEACESALGALVGAFAEGAVSGSREEWAAAVGAAQRVIDVACAAQDAAIARLAAIEPQWCEDGTLAESHRGLGHVALDAPAIVSGVLACTARHAESRVRAAVRLAGDGPAGSGTETGLGGLHAAMAAGRLDAYRAGVIAQELQEAPAEVAASVVASLEGHFPVEDGAHLRRRCRRALARISPDLLRQRALRARASCGLRRWVEEPGVDRWEGTFPSEDAARAWAAIDALARRYLADGACSGIEGARGKALTDLVAGNATIDTVLTLTVPATIVPGGGAGGAADDQLVEVTGPAGNQPVLVSRSWLSELAGARSSAGSPATRVEVAPCHPDTGALQDPGSGTDTYRPSARLAKLVRARDRRCRFPGCTVAAVFCDLDHVRPWPAGPTTATNLICLCRRHHRVKQRPGWHVTLATDGIAHWTDPTGRTRTTHPADALTTTVLAGGALSTTLKTDDALGTTLKTDDALGTTGQTGDTSPPTTATATSPTRTHTPDRPHSDLEFRLEHRGAPAPRPSGGRARGHPHGRDGLGRPHRVDLFPPRTSVLVEPAGSRPGHRPRRHVRARGDDPPPF